MPLSSISTLTLPPAPVSHLEEGGGGSSPHPLTVFGLTGYPPNKDIENDSKKEMEVSKCHSNTQPSSQMPREAVSAAFLNAVHNQVGCDVQHILRHLAKPVTSATKLPRSVQPVSATLGGDTSTWGWR